MKVSNKCRWKYGRYWMFSIYVFLFQQCRLSVHVNFCFGTFPHWKVSIPHVISSLNIGTVELSVDLKMQQVQISSQCLCISPACVHVCVSGLCVKFCEKKKQSSSASIPLLIVITYNIQSQVNNCIGLWFCQPAAQNHLQSQNKILLQFESSSLYCT